MSDKPRWTKEEELKLIRSVSLGNNFDKIGIDHNRTSSDVELRLKKIIYENMSGGAKSDQIVKLLNMSPDKVNLYYYSYKDLKEKQQSNQNIDRIETNKIVTKEYSANNSIDNFQQGVQNGGRHSIERIELKLKKLELENRILQLVVENKDLTHKLNKLIKEGRVDKSVKDLIKTVRKT